MEKFIPEKFINQFDEKLLYNKLFAAWGSARDQYGVANNYRLAHLFYKSLYKSDSFCSDEITDERGFGRKEDLSKKMYLNNREIPDEIEFTQTIVRALTSDVKYSKNLYEGAKKVVEDISKFGQIVIWTRGDVYGNEESRGSAEQTKKVATAEMGVLRRKLASERGMDRKDILKVVAGEDKIAFVKEILNSFKEKGIYSIVVIDDLVKNIETVINMAESIDNINIYPILVCQGINHSQKRIEKMGQDVYEKKVKELNGIENIADLPEKIRSFNLNEEIGIMLDFDDVLSDDFKRQDAQFESVFNKLKEKQWI